MTVASDSTRPNPTYDIRLKLEFELDPSTVWIVRSTSAKTPIELRIIHSTEISTTNAMPMATEMRKPIFITDHGSTLARVSRTRRGPPRGAGRGPPAAPAVGRCAVAVPAPTAPMGPVAGPPWAGAP